MLPNQLQNRAESMIHSKNRLWYVCYILNEKDQISFEAQVEIYFLVHADFMKNLIKYVFHLSCGNLNYFCFQTKPCQYFEFINNFFLNFCLNLYVLPRLV